MVARDPRPFIRNGESTWPEHADLTAVRFSRRRSAVREALAASGQRLGDVGAFATSRV
jgi:hypothetical protein